MLVYLKCADVEVLWKRIQGRERERLDADSAFRMTKEILEGYTGGFEGPEGEGEIVVDVVDIGGNGGGS